MKIILKHKFIILILLLAFILRFYQLGAYPPLNADEASIGYDAYSLIETGKDQHGNAWPVHFQSFNDYKPGAYVYMVLPFVYLFGLNEWSVRLPGALFGVLTVWVIYLLARELSEKLEIRNSKFEVIASLLLAISPWHIHFSRGGWEVNVATFFIVLGIYFFMKGMKENKYFVFSILSFAISLYTYHAPRVLVPLMGIGMLAVYGKELFSKENRRAVLGSVLFAAILLTPLTYNLFSQEVSARASGVSILADRGYIDRINEKRGVEEDPGSIMSRLLYNKPKEIALEFGRNYLEHFWGEFLFLSGDDIQRNKVPDFGQLYLWQFPILTIGVWGALKRPKKWAIVLIWLVVAPVPAALTFQSPHALRAQNMVIPLSILTAYGLWLVITFIKKKINKRLLRCALYVLISGIIIWDFSRYIHEYYVHMAKTYPYSSQYGVKELVSYLASEDMDSRKVIVTTRYDQPYILFLFYSKYPPAKFQNNHILTGRDKYGFSTVPEYDKYIFKNIDYTSDRLVYDKNLIVGTDEEIPDEANIIKNIYGSNNFLYFQIVK